MVIQLSKRKSECVLAFIQMQPLYISPNAEEGKRECLLFFPDDYNEYSDENDTEWLEEFQEKDKEFDNILETISSSIIQTDQQAESFIDNINLTIEEEVDKDHEVESV